MVNVKQYDASSFIFNGAKVEVKKPKQYSFDDFEVKERNARDYLNFSESDWLVYTSDIDEIDDNSPELARSFLIFIELLGDYSEARILTLNAARVAEVFAEVEVGMIVNGEELQDLVNQLLDQALVFPKLTDGTKDIILFN